MWRTRLGLAYCSWASLCPTVTVTRWSALESHQRALHTRCFIHNYISQNSLPGLITDHIHRYLIYWLHSPVSHPVSLSIYTWFSHSLMAKSCCTVCLHFRVFSCVCLRFLTLDCSWILIIAACPDLCLFFVYTHEKYIYKISTYTNSCQNFLYAFVIDMK